MSALDNLTSFLAGETNPHKFDDAVRMRIGKVISVASGTITVQIGADTSTSIPGVAYLGGAPPINKPVVLLQQGANTLVALGVPASQVTNNTPLTDVAYLSLPNTFTQLNTFNAGVVTTGVANTVSALIANTVGIGTSRTVFIKDASQATPAGFGTYSGAWTSALQIMSNDNSRGIWLNPLDAASGSNANFRMIGTGLDLWVNSTLVGGAGTKVLTATTAGQIQLPVAGSTGGLLIGGDASLYRSGTNTLNIMAQTAIDSSGRISLGTSAAPVTDRFINICDSALHPGSAASIYGIVNQIKVPTTATSQYVADYTCLYTANSLTTGNLYGYFLESPLLGTAQSIGAITGLRINNQGATGVANAFGIAVLAVSGASGYNVGIKVDGATGYGIWMNNTGASNGIWFGNVGGLADTNLYRSGVNILNTDGAFYATGEVRANSGTGAQIRLVDGGGATPAILYSGTLNIGGNFYVDTSGRAGVIGGIVTSEVLSVGNGGTHPSSATAVYGVVAAVRSPATTTSMLVSFDSSPYMTAAAYTTTDVIGFRAEQVSNVTGGAAVTNAYGFRSVSQGLTGVTNAYGFYGAATANAATLNVTARFDTGTTCALWLGGNATATDVQGGIAFGSGRDVTLYRGGAGQLIVGGTAPPILAVGGSPNTGGQLSTVRTTGDETNGVVLENDQLGGYGSAIRIFSKQNFGANTVLEAARLQVQGENLWSSAGSTSSYFRIMLQSSGTLFENLRLTSAGQLSLPTTGSTGGLLIGGDATLYRGAAGQLASQSLFLTATQATPDILNTTLNGGSQPAAGIDRNGSAYARNLNYKKESTITAGYNSNVLTAIGSHSTFVTAGASTAGLISAPYSFMQYTSGAVSGNNAGFIAFATNTERDLDPDINFVMQTGATITSVRYWVGLASADMNAVSAPTTQHVMAFRYDTAVDTTTWHAITCNGASGVTNTDTGITVSASTTYRMRIVYDTTNAAIRFFINDQLVATSSTNLPGATTGLLDQCQVTTLTTAARVISMAMMKMYTG